MTKKILITSALPYVNNVPHLGNIIGCVLSADVFARFARLCYGKENVLYICGADEHGTATETKAKEEGVSPQALCDKYFAIHKDIYSWFNISFDIFGRTSLPVHADITRELFERVNKNGFIQEKEITQPFCLTCQSFLADRFIVGTCPFCGYEDARGDQCDACGKLLNPADLVHPRCSSDGSTPEFKLTNHLFLSLDKLQPLLEDWVQTQSKDGFWTTNSILTTKAWFKEGLKPRAITRDLKWGINLPQSAFGGRYTDKVFYVWFDAPIGYMSITKQLLGDAWKEWWLATSDVSLYQFMGKDNIPFHSIIFPATLLAAGKNPSEGAKGTDYQLVYHLNATEYLNYEHTKFSKSRGVGVFGTDAKKTGIPADVFRYVLCYYRPENADAQFTWKGLQERVNNELVANFGNFVNRTLTFTKRFFDGNIIALDEDSLPADLSSRLLLWRKEIAVYVSLLEQVRLREALSQFMKLSAFGNAFFQEAAPWKSKDDNPTKARTDLALLVSMVKDLAILVEPFLPNTSQQLFTQLACKPKEFVDAGMLSLGAHELGEPALLFAKIEDEQIEALRAQFAGKTENAEEKKITVTQSPVTPVLVEQNPALQVTDIDLRVGKIIDVQPHPNAEKLFIEQVDIGEQTPVQIVSGLVGHYTPEDLLGKHIIVVKNLKPAKLRGQMSYGMLLAAQDSAETVALILAPNASPGTRVLSKNTSGQPRKEITIDEFFSVTFRLVNAHVFCGDDELFANEEGLVADKNVCDGSIR